MTTPETAVPPWVTPYLGDFAAIARILERTPGFLFQPIDLPSPDLARALADWLRGQGHTVRSIEVAEPADWRDLAKTLEHPPEAPEARPITIVIASGDPPEADLQLAFARLNMARNRLARAMAHPLLWCGDTRLHRWTHHFAPDLASVAGVPITIPLRQLDDLPEPLRTLAPAWWTGAAAEDLDQLEDDESTATDPVSRARATLRLAEAHLARGDHLKARDHLEHVAESVDTQAPELRHRWFLLHRGILVAGDKERRAGLRLAIQEAIDRSAEAEEAALRTLLAEHLMATADIREAVDELLRARTIQLRHGDQRAALRSAAQVVLDTPAMLSPENRRDIDAQASEVLHASTDPELLAIAEIILAQLAFGAQRFAECRAHCEHVTDLIAQHDVSSLAPVRPHILRIGALIDIHEGHLQSAEAKARDFLALAAQADLPLNTLIAHDLLSLVYEHDARPLEAARHTYQLALLAAQLDQAGLVRYAVSRLMYLAGLAGARVVRRHLVTDWAGSIATNPDLASAWIDAEHERLRALVDADTDEDRRILGLIERAHCAEGPAELEQLLAELDAIAKRLGDELAAQGIDPLDPDTWPEPAPPPPTP